MIGFEVAAPGIEQYKEFVEEAKFEKDEIITHSYYQWVSLFIKVFLWVLYPKYSIRSTGWCCTIFPSYKLLCYTSTMEVLGKRYFKLCQFELSNGRILLFVGRMSKIINDLNKILVKEDAKEEKKDKLVTYLLKNLKKNHAYAYRYFLCEVLNLFHIIFQMVTSIKSNNFIV